MRYILLILISSLPIQWLYGQTDQPPLEGTVTYVTPQSVYVKFSSTSNIQRDDTLFLIKDGISVPALKVKDLSSTSCVCEIISDIKPAVSDKVIFRRERNTPVARPAEATVAAPAMIREQQKDTVAAVTYPPVAGKQQIHGNVSVSSYTDFSDNSSTNSQRMKYTFALDARKIGNSNLSAECYISFVQNSRYWDEVKSNIFNGLKIYNFAISYEFSKKVRLLAGRKINPKISNMGAVDGLQLELTFKPVTIGVLAGTRPDYRDYGFNANLFQFGGYLYNEFQVKHGLVQSTLAFINQTNSGKTDRRFFYLQHVNSFVKNLTFFGSAEIDLYQKELNLTDSTYNPANKPSLTNLYLSLRYRVIKQLSLSLSYSARHNVIYYETYKSFLDLLLQSEVLQGYLFQVQYQPIRKLAIGITSAYRFEKSDPRSTRNLYGYITYSQLPWIGVSATGTLTILSTGYINGNVYGIGISKDLAAGRLTLGLNYNYVDYRYYNSEYKQLQNLAEASLMWRIYRKIFLTVYYEGTFDNLNNSNRIYAQVNWRF